MKEQDGGIKVMIGRTDDAADPNNNPLSRQLLTANLFSNVLNHVTNVDVISVSSIYFGCVVSFMSARFFILNILGFCEIQAGKVEL